MHLLIVLIVACFPLHGLADAKAGEGKAQICLTCHRQDSQPDQRFTPLLEEQPTEYLVGALMAFKAGSRSGSGMNTNARSLSKEDMQDIADYFASRPLPALNQGLDSGKVTAGARLVAEQNCASCHAATFRGAGAVPRLAGQRYPYLNWQLGLFRGGQRSLPAGMQAINDIEDIEKVASYLASLR